MIPGPLTASYCLWRVVFLLCPGDAAVAPFPALEWPLFGVAACSAADVGDASWFVSLAFRLRVGLPHKIATMQRQRLVAGVEVA